MKQRYLLFVLVIVIASISTLRAQDKAVLDTNPPPVAAPRTVIKVIGKAKASYNAYKNETYATSGDVYLFKSESGWGTLSFRFTSKDKAVQKPGSVVLNVFIASKDRTYVDNRKLVLSIDGKRIFDGTAKLSDGRTNGIDIYSSLEVILSYDDFSRVAKAEKLALQVGPTTFEIKSTEFTGFRDLLQLAEESSN